MKFRLPVLASALALMAMMAISPTAFAAGNAGATRSATATLTGTTTTGSTVVGNLTNLTFSTVNGVLNVTGTLTGTVTNALGQVTPFATTFTTAVTSANATCTVLNLVVGPIHLDLLGLVLDTSQITINITGQTGNGQLLGNLLCGIANLLNNSNGGLNGLVTALNNLLAHLGL